MPMRHPSRTPKPPLMRADAGLLAIIIGLCVVVVEVTVRSRPRRAVGSARSTRRSSIACARSSRMPLPPALVGAGPSVPRPAAVPAVMSRASRPPRIAIRAAPRATLKRPRKRAALRSSGPPRKTSSNSGGHVSAWALSGVPFRSDGNPAVSQEPLDLTHRVMAVVQDRRQQDGVSARLHGIGEILEPSRAT
jgi:hypothetical protein